MTRHEKIRQELSDQGIEIINGLPIKRKSIVDPDGYIGISKTVDTSAEEFYILEHDKWHIRMGAFYPLYSPYQLKSKIEHRVNKHALMEAVPLDFIQEHMTEDVTVDEAAEMLEVPAEVFITAIKMYKEFGMLALKGNDDGKNY